MNIIYVAALMFFYRTRTFEVRFEVHENNTDQIWRVISESSEIEKLTLTNNHIVFQENDAYILLKTVSSNSITNSRRMIFFWLGSKVSQKAKVNIAALVADLWYHLTNRQNVIIRRETQSEESEDFKSYFSHMIAVNQNITTIMDLYEIKRSTKLEKIEINLVSHIKNYSWKTGYVLDTGEDIYIYHQSFTHTEVKNVTQKLSLRLQDEKYPINDKPNAKHVNKSTFKKLLTTSSNAVVIMEKKCPSETTTLLHNTQDILFLRVLGGPYMPSKELIPEHRDICISENITDIRHCYILKNTRVNYLYIVIGIFCNQEDVQYIFRKGEEFVNECNIWKKVIFVTNSKKQPTVFLTNINIFGEYIHRGVTGYDTPCLL